MHVDLWTTFLTTATHPSLYSRGGRERERERERESSSMRLTRASRRPRERRVRDVATRRPRDAVRTGVALCRVASRREEKERKSRLDAGEGKGKSSPPTPDLQEE